MGDSLGVVIPARDEAERMRSCLESLHPFFSAGDPVVVVDHASSDGTAEIADAAGAEVVRHEEGGRGSAVARGCEHLRDRASALLVLHADMIARPETRERILDSLEREPRASGGALGHVIADPRLRFRCVEWGNRFRARRIGIPYGDQAQFFRFAALDRAGGVPRQDRFEDLEIALRLRLVGTVLYLDWPVTIPSRHWLAGVGRAVVRNGWAAARYRLQRWLRGAPVAVPPIGS